MTQKQFMHPNRKILRSSYWNLKTWLCSCDPELLMRHCSMDWVWRQTMGVQRNSKSCCRSIVQQCALGSYEGRWGEKKWNVHHTRLEAAQAALGSISVSHRAENHFSNIGQTSHRPGNGSNTQQHSRHQVEQEEHHLKNGFQCSHSAIKALKCSPVRRCIPW